MNYYINPVSSIILGRPLRGLGFESAERFVTSQNVLTRWSCGNIVVQVLPLSDGSDTPRVQ